MDRDLAKALREGKIINIDDSVESNSELMNPLPLEFVFNTEKRFEKINLPIGLEYHKTYSPYQFILIKKYLSQILYTPLTSNIHIQFLNNINEKIGVTPKVEFESNFLNFFKTLPSLDNVSKNHKMTSIEDKTIDSYTTHFLEIICLCSNFRFLLDNIQKSETHNKPWLSVSDFRNFISITKIERRLLLKNYPHLGHSIQYISRLKIILLHLLENLQQIYSKCSKSEKDFLDKINDSTSWKLFIELIQSFIFTENWSEISELLPSFPTFSYDNVLTSNSKELEIQNKPFQSETNFLISKNLPSFIINSEADLKGILLLHGLYILYTYSKSQ